VAEFDLSVQSNTSDNAKLIRWLRQCRTLKSIKLHFLSLDNLYDEFNADLRNLFLFRESQNFPIEVWVGDCKVIDSTNY